jgi:PAS domain S-box-containing protein
LDPFWVRWVPRPAIGLPILLGGAAIVAFVTVAFGLPPGFLTVIAIPIPFMATRWGRGPSYGAIAGLLLAAVSIALLDDRSTVHSLQRVFVQIGALALMWELVHVTSGARSRVIAALADSEAQYRLLLETSSVIPFEFDLATMCFTYVGPQAERILGYPVGEWLGDGFWVDHIHPDDANEAVAFCEGATARGEDHAFDYRMIASNGEIVWIHDVVALVGDRSAPTHLRGVMVDITERQLAEEQRQTLEARVLESQKLESLGLVAGGVAHDFNNLLTAILGNASLILDELPPEHPVRPKIDDLALAAERGADLTSQMLAYSGQATPEKKVRDLSAIARETARLLASTVSKKARLELDLAPSVWVRIDSGQMHQVVMNLVTNASDALEEGEGTILVRTGLEDQADDDAAPFAFIEVSDDGAGMDAATSASMFDPFFTTKFKGRGLGMAAVHGIVRSHDGRVLVDSAPGEGTCIRVLIPSCTSPEEAEAEAAKPVAPQRDEAPRGTLLLVDGEPQVRNIARLALLAAGYEVLEAGDGIEALERLREGRQVDGVVLDMTMPRLSGGETLRAIRAEHGPLPVLLVSGYSDDQLVDGDGSARTAFLQKPFRATGLAEKVAALLES